MYSTSSFVTLFKDKPPCNKINFTIRNAESIDEFVNNNNNEAYVYWYIGANGFKQGSIDFYKKSITANLNAGATPFIVDLTAWGAFRNKCQLTRYHESAISLNGDKVKSLLCSNFFDTLKSIDSSNPVFQLLQEISQRKHLLVSSDSFENIGITLGNIFNYDCPSIQNIYDLDCAKSYSVIQYIEFLFMVDMILTKSHNLETIKFLLPNDESKYYLSSMASDLEAFLRLRGHNFFNLNIEVDCFPYGSQISHRPYNCPSKTIPGKKKLNILDIVDNNLLNEPFANQTQQNVRRKR